MLAAIALPALDDLLSMAANLLVRDVRHLGRKAAQQCLTGVRMQLRFQLRTVCILTAKNPFLKDTFLQ